MTCPVCFVPGGTSMSQAVGLGILALGVVTVAVLAGFGAFFVYLVRRAREHGMTHHATVGPSQTTPVSPPIVGPSLQNL